MNQRVVIHQFNPSMVNKFDVGNILIDGFVGGVSGAIGSAGKGSKQLTNLGKQTVKRTIKATTNKGIKAGIKESIKALTYYGKNTVKYYKSFLKDLPGKFLSAVGTILLSNHIKHKTGR